MTGGLWFREFLNHKTAIINRNQYEKSSIYHI